MIRTTVSDDVSGWLDVLGPLAFYLVVWGLVFVGTAFFVGVFIPFLTGDGLLFGAGIVAGSTDRIDIWVLAIGVGVAAVAGDQVAFLLGRKYGRPYLSSRKGRWVQATVVRTEKFYELFGWWSVVIGRYMPWARVFVPVIAGIAGMPYLRFLTANIFGAVTWGMLITVLGYFAASDPSVRPIAYIVAAVVIAASIVAGSRAYRQDRASRAPTDA
ncbi:DedA family protein [Promicromonospora sp. NPDC057138]|uniref:DedA family protein n=1 Tax=Promicromonospora sp. NPDC057138 TaxID=3346031 RepID=UPI003626EDE3